MLSERVRKVIELHQVPYDVLEHREVFTAQEVAQSSHVPGQMLAKPVVVRDDQGYFMVVVNAPQHVDLEAIQRKTGRPHGRLATEEEMTSLFPDCELGAMPPIGRLYEMPTYIDEEFRGRDDIYFQAGNHHEVVKMRFNDFAKIAGPFTGEFSLHREVARL